MHNSSIRALIKIATILVSFLLDLAKSTHSNKAQKKSSQTFLLSDGLTKTLTTDSPRSIENIFLLKNENIILPTSQSAYSFDGDKFIIGQSSKLTKQQQAEGGNFRSKNIIEYPVTIDSIASLEKFYKENIKEIAFYSIHVAHDMVIFTMDVKNLQA